MSITNILNRPKLNMLKTSPEKKLPIFARHETFHPRYGWFKKGYDAVLSDPYVFSKDNAPVILGVGKNMVKSIKYWGLAFKLFNESLEKNQTKRKYELTDFAAKIFGDDGWDPYLEDPATLWLLHWEFLKLPSKATAWWFAFNRFHRISFTQEDLFLGLKSYTENQLCGYSIKDSSLLKDINCLLRMYARNTNKEKIKEDSLNCPFAELSLLRNYEDSKHFSFNVEKKHNLPAEIIVVACLEYSNLVADTAGTISASRLLHEPNSPGLIFKLTEASLCEAIQKVSQKNKSISLAESGGLVQFNFLENPKKISEKIIVKYYKNGKR